MQTGSHLKREGVKDLYVYLCIFSNIFQSAPSAWISTSQVPILFDVLCWVQTPLLFFSSLMNIFLLQDQAPCPFVVAQTCIPMCLQATTVYFGSGCPWHLSYAFVSPFGTNSTQLDMIFIQSKNWLLPSPVPDFLDHPSYGTVFMLTTDDLVLKFLGAPKYQCMSIKCPSKHGYIRCNTQWKWSFRS